MCTAFNGSMYELLCHLDEVDKLKYVYMVYFDFMCTPRGNPSKGIFPIEDIWFYLSNNGNDQVVIAMTFSMRMKKYGENMLDHIITDFVKPCITYSQYRIIETPIEKIYKRTKNSQPMVFLLYVLLRDTSIDPLSVDFFVEDGRKPGYMEEDIGIKAHCKRKFDSIEQTGRKKTKI